MPTVDKEKFYQEVYSIVREIPRGKVISYGDIARLIGWPQHSRLVGRAMSQVPQALKLPCHRVVNSQGRTVPGWAEQPIRLKEEGVSFRENGSVNMKKHAWNYE